MTQVLTDRIVDRLPEGAIVRDSKQPGLLVRVGKRTRSFRYELAHRQGDTRRTVSVPLGTRPAVSTEDARSAAARIHAERRAGRAPVSQRGGSTLGQAATEYIGSLKGRWRVEAERFYRKHLSHWAGRSLASLSDEPEAVVIWHADVTKRCGPFAANHSARVLRAIYRRRQKLDRTLPAMAPTSGITFNPQPRADRAIPFEEFPVWSQQVATIHATNPTRGAFHLLCVFCGMRPGELARLRRADVRLDAHELTVGKTKTGVDITIPTSPAIEGILRSLLAASNSEWVFPSDSSASGHMTHWREKGALDHEGNAGRHTYRTVAAALGCDELSIRLLQGHALSGISQGYITRQLLVGTSLREWQAKISARIVEMIV